MQQLEQEADDAMFVIVSDCHLDQPAVLEKLRTMFEGFSEVPECAPFIVASWSCPRRQVGSGIGGDGRSNNISLLEPNPDLEEMAPWVV